MHVKNTFWSVLYKCQLTWTILFMITRERKEMDKPEMYVLTFAQQSLVFCLKGHLGTFLGGIHSLTNVYFREVEKVTHITPQIRGLFPNWILTVAPGLWKLRFLLFLNRSSQGIMATCCRKRLVKQHVWGFSFATGLCLLSEMVTGLHYLWLAGPLVIIFLP